jgi:hypothetical protein
VGKPIALLFAVALMFGLVPVASAAAAPASPESCAVLKGTLTFKPPLPPFGSDAAVKPTLTFRAKVSHCTGPLKGTGLVTFKRKMTVAVNCASMNPKWLKVAEHIKWSDGKTSAVAAMVPLAAATDSFNGPVTAGAFRRHHQFARLTGSGPRGSCVTKPGSSTKLKLVKNVKFVIK